MTYNSLDEKYREKSIELFLGNAHVKSFLGKYNFDSPVMLEGPSGCGKTTLAGIISDRFTKSVENITHVNCAKVSTKAETEELIDDFAKTSIFGLNKVMILDEIHKLSDAAQQAWLIPLGELPSNRLVIACTTSTESVKATLLRRFIRVKVAPLTEQECYTLVDRVCQKDELTLKPWAKSLIVEESLGVPANVINFIHKVRGAQSVEEARQLLDTGDTDDIEVLELFKLICRDYVDWKGHIVPQLTKVLKKVKPEELRMAFMNLIGGRLAFMDKADDARRLCQLHDYLLSAQTMTKSPLMVGLYRYVNRLGFNND